MEIALAALPVLTGATAAGAAAVPVIGAAGSMAVPTFLAGASSAGAAAAGATGLSSLLSGVGTAASILSGGTSILSAMRSAAAGDEKAAEIEARAMDDRMAGIQRRTQMSREALDVLGSNDVAAAAAGLDLSYGQAASARERVLDDYASERTIDLQQENTRQAGYRRASRASRRSGQLDAFLKLGEGGLALAQRYG